MIELLAQAPPPKPPEVLPPADVIAYILADLAIILIAARIVGGIFVRLKQPRVVGEIIAGVLIGPTVLGGQLAKGAISKLDIPARDGSGLVNDVYPLQAFAFLNYIGLLTLVLFMFLVGLEVQQRFLRGREKQIAIVSLAVVAVPVLLGFLIASILDDPGKWKAIETPAGDAVSSTTHALFLGAALAVTAFPVMARILQEKRMIATDMGAVGVGAAALVTPLMFLVLAGAVASSKGQGVPNTVGLKFLYAVVFALVLFLVVRPLLKRVLDRRFTPDKPLDGDVVALLLVGAIASGFIADRIGIHSLNGGFLFGACVPQIEGLGRAVIARLETLVVLFLIPVFLAVSGLQTDLTVLRAEHIFGIVLFLAAMVAGKWLVGAAVGRAVGLNSREANAIGVLMNCRGLMILVVALVGKQAGVITDPMMVVFVLGAIVTTLMTGPLVDRFLSQPEVEAAREQSVAQSIAGMPVMTGGPRVLLAPAETRHAAVALAAAGRYGRGGPGPAPQFLFAHLPGLSENSDYVGASLDTGDGVTATSLSWLEPLARELRGRGLQAYAISFQSPEPERDLAALAVGWAATEAYAAREEDVQALRETGVEARMLEEPSEGAAEAGAGAAVAAGPGPDRTPAA